VDRIKNGSFTWPKWDYETQYPHLKRKFRVTNSGQGSGCPELRTSRGLLNRGREEGCKIPFRIARREGNPLIPPALLPPERSECEKESENPSAQKTREAKDLANSRGTRPPEVLPSESRKGDYMEEVSRKEGRLLRAKRSRPGFL